MTTDLGEQSIIEHNDWIRDIHQSWNSCSVTGNWFNSGVDLVGVVLQIATPQHRSPPGKTWPDPRPDESQCDNASATLL